MHKSNGNEQVIQNNAKYVRKISYTFIHSIHSKVTTPVVSPTKLVITSEENSEWDLELGKSTLGQLTAPTHATRCLVSDKVQT